MTYPFFTIGHSTRPINEFVDLLNLTKVRLIVDVRTIPQSRKNPQYNHDALPQILSECQIGYEHVAALGGLLAAGLLRRKIFRRADDAADRRVLGRHDGDRLGNVDDGLLVFRRHHVRARQDVDATLGGQRVEERQELPRGGGEGREPW